ncbi:S26 family signal peptidase [Sinomonas terrae]|uniref:S26 family signal peptidase n=1 Tax=Sinomonas terrae TaxID=2908838 RepID=A0ABS9TXK5_9MICC|nr:S26 family signal peptidase [Sinomonas terrae]MCH6469149.1 S26 family signal peptidase [Sinomonas terrae]
MDPRRRRKTTPAWLRFASHALAALLVVSLVQAFLVKLYRVPSASMEPTLSGSPRGGDWILADRLSTRLGKAPQVGDVVVVVRPAGWAGEKTDDGRALPAGGGLPSGGGLPGAVGDVARAFGDLTGIGPSSRSYLVKRIVAQGGQTIACCDAAGRLERDGVGVDEPYVTLDLPFVPGRLDCTTTPRSARCFRPFKVPPGELVLLGDHRSASADSSLACRVPSPPDPCMRTVPASAMVGRVALRVWPIWRAGVLA